MKDVGGGSNVIAFPLDRDHLWLDLERLVRHEVRSEWGLDAQELDQLLARLKVHWGHMRGPITFSCTFPAPVGATQGEIDAVTRAVDDHMKEVLAAWKRSMTMAVCRLAMVEWALMCSRSGADAPFAVEWEPKRPV
jgi:hypothetical protein